MQAEMRAKRRPLGGAKWGFKPKCQCLSLCVSVCEKEEGQRRGEPRGKGREKQEKEGTYVSLEAFGKQQGDGGLILGMSSSLDFKEKK